MDEKATAISIAAPEAYIAAAKELARRRTKATGKRVRVADLTREAMDKAYPELQGIISEMASFFTPSNPCSEN